MPGTIAYILTGWGVAGLPPWSLGYVNAPGFILLAALTALTAPLGARLAHRLPQKALKRVFAVLLALLGANMLRGAF
ncbi:MAG: TSUP family transporter [Terricaulis sp.]|nr:TSUP family transporter [Terricaulis sp.]